WARTPNGTAVLTSTTSSAVRNMHSLHSLQRHHGCVVFGDGRPPDENYSSARAAGKSAHSSAICNRVAPRHRLRMVPTLPHWIRRHSAWGCSLLLTTGAPPVAGRGWALEGVAWSIDDRYDGYCRRD